MTPDEAQAVLLALFLLSAAVLLPSLSKRTALFLGAMGLSAVVAVLGHAMMH